MFGAARMHDAPRLGRLGHKNDVAIQDQDIHLVALLPPLPPHKMYIPKLKPLSAHLRLRSADSEDAVEQEESSRHLSVSWEIDVVVALVAVLALIISVALWARPKRRRRLEADLLAGSSKKMRMLFSRGNAERVLEKEKEKGLEVEVRVPATVPHTAGRIRVIQEPSSFPPPSPAGHSRISAARTTSAMSLNIPLLAHPRPPSTSPAHASLLRSR
ncbi:hypothetical protein MKEN_00400100 [Mycena kentingensis (nom. inval.)]|nr:hypothetical protein MKEN_00400100 [Mycena kentingensis (nom. inval.)]